MEKRTIVFVLACMLAVATTANASGRERERKENPASEKEILVEKFKDRLTGCVITYEYYKSEKGAIILHGKYKRQWSIPKSDRGGWSGREEITATFSDNKLNGIVTIKCEKHRWKRKNEFVKGKGRKVSMVAVESYLANNLKLLVRNDTLAEVFNFELGDLKYEATGKVNESGELQGKYTLYKKNATEHTDNPRGIGKDWIVEEHYVCDPEYTYKDAPLKVPEVKLGYPGTSKGEHLHIKIPRLRLSMASNYVSEQ